MSGVYKATTLVGRKVEKAGRSEQQQPVSSVQSCPNKNWIDLVYKYESDRAVANASYLITDNSGQQLASGQLDGKGFAHVTGLPDGVLSVNIIYTGDPKSFEIFNDKKPIKNPYLPIVQREQSFFEKTLSVAVEGYLMYDRAQYIAGEWVLGAISGDFNDDQTLGQIIFDSAVSMIPVVDQVADGRDIAANLYQLIWKKKYDEFGPWFGLVMTTIGCIPEIGTAIKGATKSVIKVGKEAAGKLIVKSGIDIGKLIRVMNHFGEGNVVRWLRQQVGKFSEYKKWVSGKIKEILAKVMEKCRKIKDALIGKAIEVFDELIVQNVTRVLDRVDKWVDEIMGRAEKELDDVTKKAEDYSIQGVTQAPNGAKQIADQPPPLAPALERHKAARAGMETDELRGLMKHSKETDRRIIVRFTNKDALKWHGKEGYLPKSVAVKLKTAKEGELAGLVVRPKGNYDQWEEWERQNVRYLIDNGYEFDGLGRLVDSKGNRFYGDYDLQAVQRQVQDADGKKVFVNEISEPGVIDDINKDVGRPGRYKGQDKPIQHGAENDYWVKTDENGKIIEEPNYGKPEMASEEDIAAGRATLGRQHGDDEKYLVVNPDGSTEILESPDKLYDMYRKEGDELPWGYNAKPASGQDVATAQARKKADKEAAEKAAQSKAAADKARKEEFIDEIIGDGKQFDGVSLKADDGPMPFWQDNSIMDEGSFNGLVGGNNGKVPWGNIDPRMLGKNP